MMTLPEALRLEGEAIVLRPWCDEEAGTVLPPAIVDRGGGLPMAAAGTWRSRRRALSQPAKRSPSQASMSWFAAAAIFVG